MSIFGRIQFAIDVREHNKQMAKINRANREAGTEINNKANKPSDNSTSYHHENSNKKSHNPVNENKQESKTEVKSQSEQKKEKKKEKSDPKTEQQINAEAQAPAEVPGAEYISVENTAKDIAPAAMASHVHIPEPQPGVLNLGGVVINTKDPMQKPNMPAQNSQCYNPAFVPNQNTVMGQPMNPPFAAPVGNPFMQVQQQVGNPNAVMQNPVQPTGNPMIPQNMGFNINPIQGMDLYAQRMSNQQPMPGIGHHKVDKPDVKPPKPPKAEPDKIDMTGMPNPGDAMEVQRFEVIDVRTHGVLEDKVPKTVEKIELKSVFPNADMCRKYPYLVEVERVALDNNYQVAFAESPNGLINCHVADASGQYINNKGFTIDPGLIIDHRKKVFASLGPFYEGMNAYPLFINSGVVSKDKKEKKPSSNIFNEELIKGLIIGGNDTVSNTKGMYTEEFRNLNAIVALITIPTKNNSPADRKYIQNRLVDLYKSGAFNEALALNPNTRFAITEYDSNTGTIILDNFCIVKNFGGQYHGQQPIGERIQFKITKDKCKMLRGESIIQTDK